MRIRVTEYSDPGCPWAYSASPALALLQWRYGDQLDWRLVLIGLTERAEQYEQRGYTTARSALGQRGFRPWGMPFSPTPKAAISATARGCRAVVATRILAPERERAVFRALQFMQFTTPGYFDDDDSIRWALEQVPGVDADAIVGMLGSAEVSEAYEADRAEARTAEGSPTHWQGKHAQTDGPVRYTAPSLIFETQDGRSLEAGGFQHYDAYDVCLANLDTSLERRPPAETVVEAIRAFPDGLTTAEVAEIMRPGLYPADRDGVESALIQATDDGELRRVALGDDALWLPAR